MTAWTCLQISHIAHPSEAADALIGSLDPSRAMALIAAGRYQPAYRLELPDDMGDLEACEQIFLASNDEGPRVDEIERLGRPRSVSVGDMARNERTGAAYLCANIGWTPII